MSTQILWSSPSPRVYLVLVDGVESYVLALINYLYIYDKRSKIHTPKHEASLDNLGRILQ